MYSATRFHVRQLAHNIFKTRDLGSHFDHWFALRQVPVAHYGTAWAGGAFQTETNAPLRHKKRMLDWPSAAVASLGKLLR